MSKVMVGAMVFREDDKGCMAAPDGTYLATLLGAGVTYEILADKVIKGRQTLTVFYRYAVGEPVAEPKKQAASNGGKKVQPVDLPDESK